MELFVTKKILDDEARGIFKQQALSIGGGVGGLSQRFTFIVFSYTVVLIQFSQARREDMKLVQNHRDAMLPQ